MTFVWWLVACTSVCMIFYVHCEHSVESKLAKKFQFAIMQQNLQTIIMSIEERLRNLDTIYSTRSNTDMEGALEQFSRKLDRFELKLAHIETIVNIQLDKISENICTQFLKEDINRDHIKRKLDIIHENVNNRLTYGEILLDTVGRNAHENNNLLRNKLQKLEDKVTAKISDVETAISDSIVSLEEAKDVCALSGGNYTKVSDATEKNILDYMAMLESRYNIGYKEIMENIKAAESNIKTSINKTYEVIIDVEDNLNDFSNKISEIGDTIYDKTENIEMQTIRLATTLNMTRNEIQNGFRSTIIQIGKNEKSKMSMDSSDLLHEMDKKIETNFENVLLAQNIFLGTCHRLQMDESQMENKIGDIFQKLLDTIDAKILVEADDFKEINRALKNLLITKTKSVIMTPDVQYLNDLLTMMGKVQNQLLSMENGINKTIEISKENLEYQGNFTFGLVDIYELIQSKFDSSKIIPNNNTMINKGNIMNTTEIIDQNIQCIFHGINCSFDVLQINQTANDNIIFKTNNENDHKLKKDYDINVRSMMNMDDDMFVENNSEFSPTTRDNIQQNLMNEYDIEELPELQRVKSPIIE